MSGLLNNSLFLSTAAAAGGYQVERSLRFNSSDSGYCSRTPAVAGNRRTWTWAGWVKRSALGVNQSLFEANPTGGSTYTMCWFDSSDKLQIVEDQGAGGVYYPITDAVYRDASAWYHIVFTMNTTLATSTDRIKIYVNGVLQTQTGPFPPLNHDTYINATNAHRIGYRVGNSAALSAYLADIHFIDGQALTPSSFTEVSATTGQLIPKAYTGSFGTNGFWLKFSDNSNNTATTLGKDYSGNSNNWTPNNLSVTAGAGNDSLVDTPSSTGIDTTAGGVVTGNYATWNPLDTFGPTFSNGNLDAAYATASWKGFRSTFAASSGKWYWEVTLNTLNGSNYTNIGVSQYPGVAINSDFDNTNLTAGYNTTGAKVSASYGNGAYGASYTAGDVIGVALDIDAGTLVFYKNGVSQGTAWSSLPVGVWGPAMSMYGTVNVSVNFGQRPFAYQTAGTNRPASTFKALVDTNLPAPVVAKPNTVFDVKLYTGNGSTQTISGLGFSPDFVWIKNRADGESHGLFDQVRGADLWLSSNTTGAETNYGGGFGVTAFTSSGFTVGNGTAINATNKAQVAWAWDAGTTTTTINANAYSAGVPSITSSVRVNATSGLSIVTFTGTGAAATIGHGLGVAPKLLLVKSRNAAENWLVYHGSLSASSYLRLNTTDANLGPNNDVWNNTAPTSTVFSMAQAATNNVTYVAYCFAPVAGYSSFGSYTGNGSADGPFVYTGFRPRWILIKSATETAGWMIYDTARNAYNQAITLLYPNLSLEEQSSSNYAYDIVSNGFKVRNSGQNNTSSQTYIYAAFAESPFQYARAR